MSGGATEVENSLQEARNQLLGLQAAMRKAKTARVVGTLFALAIAVIYALLFISLISNLTVENFAAQAQAKLQDKVFRGQMEEALLDVANQVYPTYLEELKKAAAQQDVSSIVSEQFIELAKEVGPKYLDAMQAKASEMDLGSILREEFVTLASDVAPAYLDAFKDMAVDLELMEAFSEALSDVASQVAPVYRDEFNRVAPEILAKAQGMRDGLIADVSETAQTWLTDVMTESLQGKKELIEAQTGLTEDEVQAKLVDVVVAAETALTNVVTKRTDEYQEDLDAIQQMLAEIPEDDIKDLNYLVDELVKVSIHLIKVNLPEYELE
jgi:hypothetical protein